MNKRLTNGSTLVFDIEKIHSKNAFGNHLKRTKIEEPDLLRAFSQLFTSGWKKN